MTDWSFPLHLSMHKFESRLLSTTATASILSNLLSDNRMLPVVPWNYAMVGNEGRKLEIPLPVPCLVHASGFDNSELHRCFSCSMLHLNLSCMCDKWTRYGKNYVMPCRHGSIIWLLVNRMDVSNTSCCGVDSREPASRVSIQSAEVRY